MRADAEGLWASEHDRSRVLAAALLVLTAAAVPAFLSSALAVQIRAELGMDDRSYGLALSLYFAAMGGTSIMGGRLADRFGWRAGSYAAASVAAASLVGIALLAHSWWALVAFLVVGGISHGIASPTANLTIASELPADRRGVLLGVKQSASPVAMMIAGIFVPLIALTVGWRWAFAAALLLPLCAVALVPATADARRVPTRPRVAGGVVDRPLVVLALAGMVAAVTVGAVTTFLVISSVAAGLSVSAAGLLFALGSTTGLAVRVGAGWWADRTPTSGLRPVALLLAIGTLGLAALSTGRLAFVAVGGLVALGAGWGWPGLFHYGLIHHHEHAPATATGVVDTGLAIGTAIGPFVFGLAAGPVGYERAWALFSSLWLVAAGLVLVANGGLARRAPRPTGATTEVAP